MALPGFWILTVPQWFLLPSGSQIINCNYPSCDNYFFILLPSLTCFFIGMAIEVWFLLEQPWNSLSFIWGCSNGIQHISEGSKYESNCRKNCNYDKSFGCQGEEWITVELQYPFCNWAVVFFFKWGGGRGPLPNFNHIYATYYNCTSRTYANDYSYTRIFFSCFNTCLSLNDIFITLCCPAFLYTCKPGKSNMFSAQVKTKAQKGSDNLERKWISDQSGLKYNCQKRHLNQQHRGQECG